jgi:hypothetical protein
MVKSSMLKRWESMEVVEEGDEVAVDVEEIEVVEDSEERGDEESVVGDLDERGRDHRLDSSDGDRLGTWGANTNPLSKSRICCSTLADEQAGTEDHAY